MSEQNEIKNEPTASRGKMAHSYEELPTFEPGRDQSLVGTRWSKWLEVWELFLASREMEEIDNSTTDYKQAKTLKPLFLLKIGDEAREIYNSKRKADKSDKLMDIIAFMSDHYAPKRSVFAYVAIFYKAKRDEELQKLLKFIAMKNGKNFIPKELGHYKQIFDELTST